MLWIDLRGDLWRPFTGARHAGGGILFEDRLDVLRHWTVKDEEFWKKEEKRIINDIVQLTCPNGEKHTSNSEGVLVMFVKSF